MAQPAHLCVPPSPPNPHRLVLPLSHSLVPAARLSGLPCLPSLPRSVLASPRLCLCKGLCWLSGALPAAGTEKPSRRTGAPHWKRRFSLQQPRLVCTRRLSSPPQLPTKQSYAQAAVIPIIFCIGNKQFEGNRGNEPRHQAIQTEPCTPASPVRSTDTPAKECQPRRESVITGAPLLGAPPLQAGWSGGGTEGARRQQPPCAAGEDPAERGAEQGRVQAGCLSLPRRAVVPFSVCSQHAIKLLKSCSESPGMRSRAL